MCWCVIELADLWWLVTGGHGVSQNRGSLRLCLSPCLTVIRWCVPGTLHQLSQFCNLRLISQLSLFISCPTVVGVHLFLRWPVWWGTNGTIEELPSRDNDGGAKTANMWKCEECGQKRQKSAAVQDRARKAKIRKAHQREPALEQWRSVQRLKWKKCIKCSWAMVNFWNEALVDFFRIQIGNWFLLWLMNLVIDEVVQNKAIFVLWNKWASKVGAFTTVRNSATTWTSKRFISHNSLLKFMYTKNLSIWKGAVMLDPLLACDPRLPGILINVSCFPTLTSHTPVLTLTISQTAASIFHHGIPCLGRKYISQCLTIPLLLFPHSPHTQCLKILYTQVSTVPDH